MAIRGSGISLWGSRQTVTLFELLPTAARARVIPAGLRERGFEFRVFGRVSSLFWPNSESRQSWQTSTLSARAKCPAHVVARTRMCYKATAPLLLLFITIAGE
jgi:hypothetical protein